MDANLTDLSTEALNAAIIDNYFWIEAFVAGYELPDALHESGAQLFASLPPNPGWRFYLGLLDGRPVAVSPLFLGAGVAGIYCVATVPWARRRGYGAAVTLAALRDARASSYKAAVLEASTMGFPIYERMGFRLLRRMSNYLWRAGSAA